MAKPRINGRVKLLALFLLLVGSSYYGIAVFRDAPADNTKGSVAAKNAVKAISAEPEDRLEEPPSHANPNSELSSEVSSADGFSEPEEGTQAFRPDELYAEYVDEADAGNLDAQYVLVTALDECRRGASTEEDIAALERRAVAEKVLQAIEDRFHRCKHLRDAVPNVETEYQQRYQAARDGQHPLVLVKQRGISVDEKRRRVMQAITRQYPESHLYARAYMEAAILYREYPEMLDIHREEAWLLMGCEADFHCDSQKEREYLREKYHAHDYDEIVAIEASIRRAIGQQDWNDLGL